MTPMTMTKILNKNNLFNDLGYQPHPGQRKIHNSRAPRRVLATGSRWGKTTAAAMEGLAAALQPAERSIGWIASCTYDLADRVYREIVSVASNRIPHRIIAVRESEKRLLIRNMAGGISEIRAESADNPISLLGEGLDWLVIDEASRLRPNIWQGHLSQRLIDKRGWALLISTPHGKGWFYDLYLRGQGRDPDYDSWTFPSWSNPYLDAALIEEERSRLPERVFREQYGGEFLEGSGQVFRNIRECATGEFKAPQASEVYYAGLDLAKTEDFTVLVIMNSRREVVYLDRFNRIDWSLQVNRIAAAAGRYNSVVLVDSTGVGEPIYESLCEAGIFAEPYVLTMRSKTALINGLALMLEKQEIILPRPDHAPVLIDELESYQYSVTDMGHVRSGSPAGAHDDAVIALALAAWRLGPAYPAPMIT